VVQIRPPLPSCDAEDSVGGPELKPSIFTQVTEAIASVDGSTGWGVRQSNGCSNHQRVSRSEHCPGDFRQAGRNCRLLTAGYSNTGKWRFMSGSQNATRPGADLRVGHEGNQDVPSIPGRADPVFMASSSRWSPATEEAWAPVDRRGGERNT
jgi:hypothetical protein